jgi:F0F1-type ATP synthase assembly protein I
MSNRKLPSDFVRYSGAGIQMVMIIGLFVFFGTRLDKRFATSKPWWTLGLSLFGVIVALIFMVRSLESIGKDQSKGKKPPKEKK